MRTRTSFFATLSRPFVGLWLLIAMAGVAGAAEVPSKRTAPTRFVAELALDAGSTTYFFRHKMSTFALELAPRFGFVVADFVDVGLAMVAGWNSGTKAWTQAAMFGIGPYAGLRVPLSQRVRLMPWVGALYHQTFMDGFATGEPTNTEPTATAARQIIRLDLHVDAVFRPLAQTALTLGVFAKTRAASFGPTLGSSPELGAGVRVGAISYF